MKDIGDQLYPQRTKELFFSPLIMGFITLLKEVMQMQCAISIFE
jgi:hypothetical protein